MTAFVGAFRPRWRTARRPDPGDLVASLRGVADELRGGASLRQAIAVSARRQEWSPLSAAAAALAAGCPLVAALRDAAAQASDRDLASALGVLAVHAEAGGDPLPAVTAVADRTAERESARRESRALTTQARLGARVVLLLTPGFLLLLAASDPAGAVEWVRDPQTRGLVLAGAALQILGALWVTAIVAGAVSFPRWADAPVVRAAFALMAGRGLPASDDDVADAAETMALALDAGLSASAAVAATAPYVGGDLGEAMRRAVSMAGVPAHQALSETTADLEGDAHARLCTAVRTSATLGTPLAPALRRLASEVRQEAKVRLAENVRRAGVRALLPLGLLVLPAFVLTCLVPLLLGGLRGITG